MHCVDASSVAERVARSREQHKAKLSIQAEEAAAAPVGDPEASTGRPHLQHVPDESCLLLMGLMFY